MKKTLYSIAIAGTVLVALSAQAAPAFPQSGTWEGTYSVKPSTGGSCEGVASGAKATLEQTGATPYYTFSGTLTLYGFNNKTDYSKLYPDYGNGAPIDPADINPNTFTPPLYPVFMSQDGSLAELSSTSGYNDSAKTIHVMSSTSVPCILTVDLTYQG